MKLSRLSLTSLPPTHSLTGNLGNKIRATQSSVSAARPASRAAPPSFLRGEEWAQRVTLGARGTLKPEMIWLDYKRICVEKAF